MRRMLLLPFIAVAGCKQSEMSAPKADTTNLTTLKSNCTVVQESDGILFQCGDTTAFLAHGNHGTNGINGTAGAQGSIGLTGAQGADGVPGSVGPQGVAGPRGLQGPPGSAMGSELWLVRTDGTPVGRIIELGGPVIWDDVNDMAVRYRFSSSLQTFAGLRLDENHQVTFATSDCSGAPYYWFGLKYVLPGESIVVGDQIYKLDSSIATFAPQSRRRKMDDGTMSGCEPSDEPQGSFYRMIPVDSSHLPRSMDPGTYKIEKR